MNGLDWEPWGVDRQGLSPHHGYYGMRFHFDVRSPLLHPVAARTGDALVVRPGHPTAPLVVIRRVRGRWTGIAIGPANYGALAGLLADGIITPWRPADAAWLSQVA